MRLIRKAVDRLLAKERVDPGIEVEDDQVACVFCCGSHGAEFMDDPSRLCEG
ncbi:MAG: hypothetical protein WBW06_06720 [Xanthobacteraceae bacterium]